IAAHLRTFRREKAVVITTYKSAIVLSAAARNAGFVFDLAIFDEAHKTAVRNDSLFSHLLFDKNLPIPRRLFMTATERRYVGDSDEIVSMDDAEIFGDTFELLTFKEAIQADEPILCDYSVLAMAVKESEIEKLIRSDAFV